jgi:hypothetical protein
VQCFFAADLDANLSLVGILQGPVTRFSVRTFPVSFVEFVGEDRSVARWEFARSRSLGFAPDDRSRLGRSLSAKFCSPASKSDRVPLSAWVHAPHGWICVDCFSCAFPPMARMKQCQDTTFEPEPVRGETPGLGHPFSWRLAHRLPLSAQRCGVGCRHL